MNLYKRKHFFMKMLSLADEKGTKAAAVTAVMGDGAAPIQEYKTVYLDRPFVYMLIDCRSNVPFFIGTLMDVPKH